MIRALLLSALLIAPRAAFAACETVLATDSTKVNKTGDTMTGALQMTGAAINLSGAAGIVTGQSSMTASSFFGDGSHLTGIPSTSSIIGIYALQLEVSASTTAIAVSTTAHAALTGTAAHGATSANTASQIVVRGADGSVLSSSASLSATGNAVYALNVASAAYIANLRVGQITYFDNKTSTTPSTSGGGGAAGGNTVIQVSTGANAAQFSISAVIPDDDTKPQITEGGKVVVASMTVTSATSRLCVRAAASFVASTLATCGCALFRDNGTDALQGATTTPAGAAYSATVNLPEYCEPAGSSGVTNYHLRCGPLSAATIYINGTASGRRWGGATAAVITITEMTP